MGVQLPSEPITRKEQYLAKAAGQAVEIPEEPITREEAYLDAIAKGSGGGGGTSDYPQLTNKPQINGNTLVGNKTASQLGLASTADLAEKVDKVEGKGLSTNDYTDAEKAIVGGVTTALTGKVDKVEGKGLSENDYTDSDKAIVDGVTAAIALKQDKTDNSLDTEAKTIVGAINEHEGDIGSLKSGLTTLDNEVNGDATTYPYADVITIEDAVPANLADCKVKIEPVQDLHGYDKPWVGGAGSNQWDEDWESGAISGSTGEKAPNDTKIRSKNYIAVTAGNNYYFVHESTAADLFFYDSNYQYLGYNDGHIAANTSMAFTVPSGASYMLFSILQTTYSSGIAINYPATVTSYATYTNICPISGHTEASVQRDGVNILDAVNHLRETASHNITSTANADGSISISGTIDSTWAYITDVVNVDWEPGTYTFSIVTALSHNIYLELTYDDNTTQNFIIASGDRSATITTAKKLKSYTLVISTLVNGTQYNETYYLQVEKGASATEWKPYSGKTYTIALGDTIYGGNLDVKTGVLTVTYAIDTYDGSNDEEWTIWQSGGHSFRTYTSSHHVQPPNNQTIVTTSKCNELALDTPTNTYDSATDYTISTDMNASRISIVVNSTVNTTALLREWLAEHPLQLCYELATPTTIQLTPQQIQLLKGQNTLTASTGDISVTVNGVSGSIGQVQEQANATDEALAELADKLPTAPTTDGAYVLTVTVTDGTPTYSWESAT